MLPLYLATGFDVIDVANTSDMATAIGLSAAVLFVSALGVGAGYRIAKKAFGWVLGRI